MLCFSGYFVSRVLHLLGHIEKDDDYLIMGQLDVLWGCLKFQDFLQWRDETGFLYAKPSTFWKFLWLKLIVSSFKQEMAFGPKRV